MRKLYWILAFTICLTPNVAQAEWRPWGGPLLRDAPVKIEPGQAGPLVLMSRNLVIYDGEIPRRAFSLTGQNDGLVDIASGKEVILLASRRSIWRSDDRGYTWRKLVTLAPRDPDEWLGVVLMTDGRAVAVSRTGVKRILPGSMASERGLEFGKPTAVLSAADALLLHSSRGLLSLGHGATEIPYRPAGKISAYARFDDAQWIADASGVQRCEEKTCTTEAGASNITAIARGQASYWLASTDTVWRRRLGEAAWNRATEGLGSARIADLQAAGGNLLALTNRGLYAWRQAVTAPPAAALMPPARPSMAEVRRMVLESLDALQPGTAASWQRRVRWRAAAPQVGLSLRRSLDARASRTLGNTISLSTTENRIVVGPDGESVTDTDGRGIDYGVTLTWSLDNLVFNSQELSVSNELEDLFRLRESILLDVTRLYYDRMRTLAQRNRETDPYRRLELELRAAEIAAELDFYTNGRFSRALTEEP